MEHPRLWRRLLTRLGVQIAREEDLVPRYEPEVAAAGRYIFVYDDDVSTMAGVVRWLERGFDMDRGAAALAMLGIHWHGYGVLGPFSAEEVERRMERGRQLATELGLGALLFSRDPPA